MKSRSTTSMSSSTPVYSLQPMLYVRRQLSDPDMNDFAGRRNTTKQLPD